MLSYPARVISTPDEQVNILQITDLHISDVHLNSNHKDVHCCRQRFEAVLAQALNENKRCDLILVTGDLVSKVNKKVYDHIFDVLSATQIPFACIAGNHDVTDEFDSTIPFDERELIAQVADARLLSRHVIHTAHWQLLLLDSSIPGAIAGEIKSADVDWLCEQLSTCDKPTVIALHHHILAMNSEWIDVHIAKNTEYFWQRMADYPHLRVIISGHTHQEKDYVYDKVRVYSTPSTCYQFKPFSRHFSYDEDAQPGYRWLQLANNGQVASWVKRLDT